MTILFHIKNKFIQPRLKYTVILSSISRCVESVIALFISLGFNSQSDNAQSEILGYVLSMDTSDLADELVACNTKEV